MAELFKGWQGRQVMTALFEGLTHWHWLGLGFVLLAIEVLGSVGFLLWTGIAALEVGLLLLVWPFGWQAQLLLFAVQSLLTTWAWWRWQHRRDRSGRMPPPHQRADAELSGAGADPAGRRQPGHEPGPPGRHRLDGALQPAAPRRHQGQG